VQIDSGERVVVGVNRYRLDSEDPYQPLRVDPAIEDHARERLAVLRSSRSSFEVQRALDELRRAAKDAASNVLYPMKRALAARATVGEVCDALRDVWGTYVPSESF
jgi:methylmalonyl-CoA mutase N-terminal domain/subunit